MDKEDIELAEEHVELAEQIVLEQARKVDDSDVKTKKALEGAALSLEKAEVNLKDAEK